MEQEESGEDFSDVELSGDEDSRDLANRIRERTGMCLVWFANLVGIKFINRLFKWEFYSLLIPVI